MRKILTLAGLLVLSAGAAFAEARSETRCGWFVNPTPGNFYLTDAEGDWWFASQGSLEVGGWEELDWSEAEFGADWVATNGSYGYGCACAGGDYGRAAEGEVWFIDRLKALPLAKCLRDPALPPPPRD
ncbi:DUF4087 domain-containing protein [Rhodobacter capsulatus]|uniref:DUF4087 domain-containing protein n=1 Tax=Rhodobacter capsulatus TaxID=1061 RepID=UPI0006DC51DA|nr:DUF4087 domain-containing protein [Rhodobacter capsulatus]KQB12503.1 hypothetical protein AP071_06855 [Rhodobacter capsulatus]KQB16657.1 hypothetical protein AP073_10175 [Rhodobacter capsulatus]PZX26521.1 uncharacterized protein DUF4087 [Rhodobacter capsulatus]QNR62004.1 DUF4087 domain-containing protein [Rhodobacter capsulatus]